MSVFYKNYLALCAKKSESPTSVAIAVGLSNAAATGWKKGKNPSDVTLEKLSDYFGVPVSDLIQGPTKAPTTESERKPGAIQITLKNSVEKKLIDIVHMNADGPKTLERTKKLSMSCLTNKNAPARGAKQGYSHPAGGQSIFQILRG